MKTGIMSLARIKVELDRDHVKQCKPDSETQTLHCLLQVESRFNKMQHMKLGGTLFGKRKDSGEKRNKNGGSI